jgi:hypothetical protein
VTLPSSSLRSSLASFRKTLNSSPPSRAGAPTETPAHRQSSPRLPPGPPRHHASPASTSQPTRTAVKPVEPRTVPASLAKRARPRTVVIDAVRQHIPARRRRAWSTSTLSNDVAPRLRQRILCPRVHTSGIAPAPHRPLETVSNCTALSIPPVQVRDMSTDTTDLAPPRCETATNTTRPPPPISEATSTADLRVFSIDLRRATQLVPSVTPTPLQLALVKIASARALVEELEAAWGKTPQ